MVQRLALAGEAAGTVGHDTLSLGGADWKEDEFKCAVEGERDVPAPHRLVFPLLQNLHSRHSVREVSQRKISRRGR